MMKSEITDEPTGLNPVWKNRTFLELLSTMIPKWDLRE